MNHRPIIVRRSGLKFAIGLIALFIVLPQLGLAEDFGPAYQHTWMDFPKLTGEDVLTGQTVSISPHRGQVIIAFFLASWCVPCQKITPSLIDLAKSKQKSQLQIYFIFAHDAKSDAQGFAKEYQLNENIILADHDLLAAFKNPPLPSIFLSDRNTWLLSRWLEPSDKDMGQLRRISDLMTIF